MVSKEVIAWLKGEEDDVSQVPSPTLFKQVSWVYACISRIANSIAFIPNYLTEKGKMVPDSHLMAKLFRRPCGFVLPSITDFLRVLVGQRELFGESFMLFKVKDEKVWPTLPKDMEPVFNLKKNEVVGWTYNLNGTKHPLLNKEVLFFKYPSLLNPLRGMGPLTAARLAAEQDLLASCWNKDNFKEGVHPDVFIESERNLTPKQRGEFRDEIQKSAKNPNKRRVLVLGGGTSATFLGINNRELQYLEGRKMSREEVCAVFGVPPALIEIYQYANYANARYQGEQFWELKLIPIMLEVKTCIDNQLEMMGYEDFKFVWDISDVIQQYLPIGPKAKALKELIDAGISLEEAIEYTKLYKYKGLEVRKPPKTASSASTRQVSAKQIEKQAPANLSDRSAAMNMAWMGMEGKAFKLLRPLLKVFFGDIIEHAIKNEGDLCLYPIESWYDIFDKRLEDMTRSFIEDGSEVAEREAKDAVLLETKSTLFETPLITPGEARALSPLVREVAAIYKSIPLTLRDEVARRTTRLMAAGKSMDDIAFDLHNYYFVDAKWARSMSRQLVGTAYNTGKYARFISKGVALNRWRSMQDGKVRLTHKKETNNIVPVGMRFPVTGLRFPHDPLGPSKETMGCRCTIEAVQKGHLPKGFSKGMLTPKSLGLSYLDLLKVVNLTALVKGWQGIGALSNERANFVGSELSTMNRSLSRLNSEGNSVSASLSPGFVAAMSVSSEESEVINQIQRDLSRYAGSETEVLLDVGSERKEAKSIEGYTIKIPRSEILELVAGYAKREYNQSVGNLHYKFGSLLESLYAAEEMREYRESRLGKRLLTAEEIGSESVDLGIRENTFFTPFMGKEGKPTIITAVVLQVIGRSIWTNSINELGQLFLSDSRSYRKVLKEVLF